MSDDQDGGPPPDVMAWVYFLILASLSIGYALGLLTASRYG